VVTSGVGKGAIAKKNSRKGGQRKEKEGVLSPGPSSVVRRGEGRRIPLSAPARKGPMAQNSKKDYGEESNSFESALISKKALRRKPQTIRIRLWPGGGNAKNRSNQRVPPTNQNKEIETRQTLGARGPFRAEGSVSHTSTDTCPSSHRKEKRRGKGPNPTKGRCTAEQDDHNYRRGERDSLPEEANTKSTGKP